MDIKLIVDYWEQPAEDGYVSHVRDDVVSVDEATASWLIGAGSAIAVENPKPKTKTRGRSTKAADK